MNSDLSHTTRAAHHVARSDIDTLHAFAVAIGLGWSAAFILVGLHYDLQMFGDGSIFSYAVAVQDVWAFHWHNISGRVFVYLVSLLPAETYVGLTGDAAGGVALYGMLFYAAPLCGLLATRIADRSGKKIIFGFACASTACVCPLVFGFPTEMWMAHAVFWPALAVIHFARAGAAGTVLRFAVLLMLILTHGAGPVLALAILATLVPRGLRDPALFHAASALAGAVIVWLAIRIALPPDDYFGAVLVRAAMHFFDVTILAGSLMLLIFAALGGYAVVCVALYRLMPAKAHLCAAALVSAALLGYWMAFDHALHAENRYYLRTVMLIATAGLGMIAAVYMLRAEGLLKYRIALMTGMMDLLARGPVIRAAIGGCALIMLIHVVETAKFVEGWTNYKAAVRGLATGTQSDLALGDARFVSSARLGDKLNRLAWSSTTPFLSALVAPDFSPSRLVIDPEAGYFWLSCETATANLDSLRAVPARTRALIRTHACLHR